VVIHIVIATNFQPDGHDDSIDYVEEVDEIYKGSSASGALALTPTPIDLARKKLVDEHLDKDDQAHFQNPAPLVFLNTKLDAIDKVIKNDAKEHFVEPNHSVSFLAATTCWPE